MIRDDKAHGERSGAPAVHGVGWWSTWVPTREMVPMRSGAA